MPETPVDIKPVGKLRPLKAEIKPVGTLRPFQGKPEVYNDPVFELNQKVQEDKLNKDRINQAIDAIPGLSGDTDSEDKKEILRDLVKNNASQKSIRESMDVLTGKHPKQEGGSKYYMDETGVPHPLANNERPPSQYHVASHFGSQKAADDDNIFTSTAKHAWNGIVGAAEGFVDLGDAAQGLFTGSESEKAQSLKNAAKALKFETKSSERGEIYSGSGFKDILNPDAYNFNFDNVSGNILQGMESVVSFALGAKGFGTAIKVVKGGQALSKAQTIGAAAAGGYNLALTQMLDVGKEAGLQDRDLYAFGTTAAVPQAVLEFAFGPEAMLTANNIMRGEFKNLAKISAKTIEKDESGNITKAGLDQLNKEMTVAAASLGKKYGVNVLKGTGEEFVTEGVQQWTEEASKQLYNKLADDPKFKGADAFSPETANKVINASIAGLLGSVGPSAVFAHQATKIEHDKAMSENIFEQVKKSDGAVRALKVNAREELKRGELSKEEHDDLITRLNAYKEYNDITGSLNLNDEKKREAFDKTFQKQNLESELRTYGDPDKLHPLKQGEYKAKEQMANELQKDINTIIFEAQAKEATTIPNKIIKEEVKKAEKEQKTKEKPKDGKKVKKPILPEALQAHIDKYKKKENEPLFDVAEKKFEDVPVNTFNDYQFSKYQARDKHRILSDYLEKQPNSETSGKVGQKATGYKDNTVFNVNFSGGREIKFSSSQERGDQWHRGHLRWEALAKKDELTGYYVFDPKEIKGKPVGMKVYHIEGEEGQPARIPVIKIYSQRPGANYGKFVGWAKATGKGKGQIINNKGEKVGFSEAQSDKLIDLELKKEEPPTRENGLQKPSAPINTPQGQAELENIALKAKPLAENNVKELVKQTKDQFVASQIEALRKLADEGVAEFHEEALENGTYQRFFENQYDKENGKTTISDTSEQEKEPVTGNSKETGGNSDKEGSGEKVRKERAKPTKIKDRSRLDALKIETYSLHDIVMQYFIGGGRLNSTAFRGLYQNAAEIEANKPLRELEGRSNYVTPKSDVTIDGLAHDLWERSAEKGINKDSYDTADWKDAIEDVLNSEPASVIEMAQNLLKKHNKEQRPYSDPEEIIIDIAKDAEKKNVLDEVNDGIEKLEEIDDEGLNAAADEKDPFWDDESWKERMPDTNKLEVKKGEHPFQKVSKEAKDNVHKIMEVIQKALPKINVVYNPRLNVAGQLSADGKTIEINPEYAGNDTPIHEAGHVLIDAMGGTKNKVIKAAIEQLKGTDLWNEIKERYPELSEENLGKEVLAEAIGREGAGIFKEQSAKNQFQAFLEYIFDWLSRKLGLSRNIAKSLAKQIISGINTKKLEGTNTGVVQKQKKKFPMKEFNKYREDKLGRDVREEKSNLNAIEAVLENEETLSEEDIQQLNDARDAILTDREEDKVLFKDYRKEMARLRKIGQAEDFSGETLEDILAAYRFAKEQNDEGLNDIKIRLADYINHERIQEIKTIDPEIEEKANNSDMTYLDRFFKVLNDVSEKFPPLQGLSKEFDRRWVAKVRQANELHKEHERLGKAVIREKNALLGKASDLITSNSVKYFNYLEVDGKLRTNTAGLSKVQKEYLEFVQKLTENRQKQFKDDDGNIIDNTLIKTDKGFWEQIHSKEYKGAWATMIKNLNPSEKRINLHGELKSRFDQAYKGDNYSRDFFKATKEFIDETAHIENMRDLVPIVDGIELFYKSMGEHSESFNNTIQFLEKWKTNKLYRQMEGTSPTLDMIFRNLRLLTTARIMGFNIKANVYNVAVGNFGTFRDDHEAFLIGQKRFATDLKKSLAIAKHYDLGATDYETNPKTHAGKLFAGIAYVGMKWGEAQIQTSQMVGQMSEQEWQAFKYKDGKLTIDVPSNTNEKDFEDKIISYRNHVSEIQGRYSEKDRRNYMNTELGKLLGQFSTWVPDWYGARMGKEFIDSHNNVRRGTWRMFTDRAMKEIKADWKGGTIHKNKQVMANIKGLIIVAALMAATYEDDEDKKKKKQALSLENGLQNILFIFDINQLEWKVKQPAPAFGTVNAMIDVMKDMKEFKGKKLAKDAKKLLPYNKLLDLPEQLGAK